jgi:hypothetical protein
VGWQCGFYPASHLGEHSDGGAFTFDEHRAGFKAAWQVFLSNRTDLQKWRDKAVMDRAQICHVDGRGEDAVIAAEYDVALFLRRDLRQSAS